MNRKTIAAGLLMVAGVALVGAGCSEDYKGLGDAPVGERLEEKRDVILMPDQFANIAMACDGHGHRVYSTTRSNATITVVTDPTCPGGSLP